MKNKNPNHKSFRISVPFLHRIGRNAYVDWALSVAIFCILSILAVVGAILVYRDTRDLKTDVAANAKAAQNFDEQALNRVLSAYEDRAKERANLSNGYNGPIDPSL